jgi:DNA-binding protein HU-beta
VLLNVEVWNLSFSTAVSDIEQPLEPSSQSLSGIRQIGALGTEESGCGYVSKFPQPLTHWRYKLNKAGLIEALVKETDMSKAEAGRTINALVAIITKTVAKKEDVQLIGFGTFKATKRAARKGKNPRTGEALKIATATVPKFTAGAAFKAAVNKKK